MAAVQNCDDADETGEHVGRLIEAGFDGVESALETANLRGSQPDDLRRTRAHRNDANDARRSTHSGGMTASSPPNCLQ